MELCGLLKCPVMYECRKCGFVLTGLLCGGLWAIWLKCWCKAGWITRLDIWDTLCYGQQWKLLNLLREGSTGLRGGAVFVLMPKSVGASLCLLTHHGGQPLYSDQNQNEYWRRLGFSVYGEHSEKFSWTKLFMSVVRDICWVEIETVSNYGQDENSPSCWINSCPANVGNMASSYQC